METSKINTSKNQIIVLLLCGGLLLGIYGGNIAKIVTVWELGDEASYLWNTAFFLQTDWDEIGAAYAYSGYGYSLILIPVFLLSKTGVGLIQGACIINLGCLLLTYVFHMVILRKISKNFNSVLLPVYAFVSCCTPYLASNVYKVLAEVFLSFWYSLIILLFLYAINTKKKIIYVLLGSSSAFMMMIHTRAVMVFISLSVIFFLLYIKKGRKELYNFICFVMGFVGLVFVLYMIKNGIVQQRTLLNESIFNNNSNKGNLLTLTYINNRLKDLFSVENIVNYVACFWGKVLYVVLASAALILFYCMDTIKKSFVFMKSKRIDIDDREYTTFVFQLFIILNLGVTLVACTVNGPGSDVRYTFYGRYFEYTLPILICVSMDFFVKGKISLKEIFALMSASVLIGAFVLNRQSYYLRNQEFWVDTNRLAALTKIITECETLPQLIFSIVLFCTFLMGIYIIISRNKYGRLLVIPVAWIMLWVNSSLCIEEIISINEKSSGDTEIAEYVLENSNQNKVYMIDDNSYKYPYYYSRMQILLKDMKLNIIEPAKADDIEDGAFVVAYVSTDLKDTLLGEYDYLKEGQAFLLYQK